MAARGRRTGDSRDSREAILRAARVLFAKRGFRGTTLRAVASRARVDLALVSYFFGSKDELFESAIDLPSISKGLTGLLQDPSPGVGQRLVRFYLEHVFREHHEGISAMLRTALGDAEHTPKLRSLIRDSLLQGAARAIDGRHGKLRAELFGAQMTGLFVSRYLVRVEPLASASVEQVSTLLGPAVEAVLGFRARAEQLAVSSPHAEVES